MKRIAMWSGPRNVSTAMMRSWGNRPDTKVVDEPFYAYYLKSTGYAHPMADEVMGSQSTEWEDVVLELTRGGMENGGIFYQKHMTHHILKEIPRDWLSELTHVFLIRDPREMLVSLDEKTPKPKLEDTGYPQQSEIHEWVKINTDQNCPVIDSKDLLENPRGMLSRLCDVLEIPFYEDMLSWPAGRRTTDGVWAPHWYGNVEKSTGFEPYRAKNRELPAHLAELDAQCQHFYQKLKRHRLEVC